MRVLFVCYPWLGLRTGGLQTQIRETGLALSRLGVDISYFDRNVCSFDDYDLVHAFSLSPSVLPILQECRESRTPVVVSPVFNGNAYPAWATPLLTRMSRTRVLFQDLWSARAIALIADRLLALSISESRLLQRSFGVDPSRIHVVSNGVASQFLEGETWVPPLEPYVVTVGSISQNKNQMALIEACRELNLPLKIVGRADRGSETYLQRLRERGGADVTFLGQLAPSSPDLVSTLLSASVFVLPSRSEVVPISALEAYALGLPLVITRNSALATVLPPSDGIVYCAPKASALVTGIRSASEARSREWPVERSDLSWMAAARRVLEVYSSVV